MLRPTWELRRDSPDELCQRLPGSRPAWPRGRGPRPRSTGFVGRRPRRRDRARRWARDPADPRADGARLVRLTDAAPPATSGWPASITPPRCCRAAELFRSTSCPALPAVVHGRTRLDSPRPRSAGPQTMPADPSQVRAVQGAASGVGTRLLSVARGDVLDDAERERLGVEADPLEDGVALGVVEELLRDAVQPERRGARPASLSVWSSTAPQPPTRPLSSMLTTSRCSRASVDERRVDRLDPARVDDGDADALGDQPLGDVDGGGGHRADADDSTSWAPLRTSTSAPPARPTASRSVGRRPLGEAHHGRGVVDLDRLVEQLAQPGRRRAARRAAGPGTTWRIDMSHMPLWLAPSSPVTPARSSTKVTPHRCSATSISTWSKARLRKVA